MLRLSALGIQPAVGRSRSEEWLIQLFCLSIVLLPLGFLTVKSWGTTLPLIAFLLSLVLIAARWKEVELSKTDLIFCFAFMSPFFIDLAAQLLRSELIPRQLDASSRLIVFVPIYIALKTLKPQVGPLFGISISIGLIFSLGHIYVEPEHHWGERWASHPSDPNTLGLFTAALLGYLFFRAGERSTSTISRLVTLSGIFSGGVILIASQSRGAWLASAVLFACACWVHRRSMHQILVAILIPLAIAAAALVSLKPALIDRALSIPQEIGGWIKGTGDVNSGSIRLDMLLLSGPLIMNAPALLHGYGDGAYKDKALAIASSQGELAAAETLRVTPHNEVIGKLLKSGVFGGIAAAFVLLLPVIAAIQVAKRADTNEATWSWFGLALGTCLASLTMGVLGLAYTASFHAIVSAIICSQSVFARTR